MRKLYPFFMFVCWVPMLFAQQSETRDLPEFHKLIVHPFIELELNAGDQPKMIIEAENWSTQDVIAEKDGKALHIYLKGAKTTNIDDRWPKFENVRVKIFVLYNDLKKLSVRGADDVIVQSPIEGKKFKLKLFGEQRVYLSRVDTDIFKASIFGDTKLIVGDGYTDIQKWRIFGDINVDTGNLKSNVVSINNFGELKGRMNASSRIKLNSFGVADLSYNGDPRITKVAFGETDINKN